jgi:hypothetical protein
MPFAVCPPFSIRGLPRHVNDLMCSSRVQISFPDEIHPYACKSFAFSANLEIAKVKQSHPYEVLGRREQATFYIESILWFYVGMMAYLDKTQDSSRLWV